MNQKSKSFISTFHTPLCHTQNVKGVTRLNTDTFKNTQRKVIKHAGLYELEFR